MVKMRYSEPIISEQKVAALAKNLIEKESTMALATARDNRAWSAPVYFVFHKSGFYFFSDPMSRHIQESRMSTQVSATIYPSVSKWQEIRGVQMSGSIEGVSPGLDAIQAIRAYIRKFPFTKEFFKPRATLDLVSFGERFKVRLYRFDPQLIYYLDNEIRFGFRQEVIL
jgi:uncharacterized protein YhbP (UPF0306 family)